MRTYTADEVDEMIGRALAREREQQELVACVNGCQGFFKHSPQPSKPLTGILSIARHHPDGRVVTVSFKTKDEARTFEQYAIESAHGITGEQK